MFFGIEVGCDLFTHCQLVNWIYLFDTVQFRNQRKFGERKKNKHSIFRKDFKSKINFHLILFKSPFSMRKQNEYQLQYFIDSIKSNEMILDQLEFHTQLFSFKCMMRTTTWKQDTQSSAFNTCQFDWVKGPSDNTVQTKIMFNFSLKDIRIGWWLVKCDSRWSVSKLEIVKFTKLFRQFEYGMDFVSG